MSVKTPAMRCLRRQQSEVVYCQMVADQMAEGQNNACSHLRSNSWIHLPREQINRIYVESARL